MKFSLNVFQPTARMTFDAIIECEKIGVKDVWVPTLPLGFDPTTLLGAVAAATKTIQLGTGIAIVYPKHPLALATEAFVLGELAPGRIRLGVGSSHPFIISGMYGIDFAKPVKYMREYLTVLRQMLWEGQVNFEGEFFQVHGAPMLPTIPPQIPLLLAALRKPMFKLGGELSDGIMTGWSPLSYVLSAAKPALRDSAASANRPTPPLIGSLSIIPHPDRDAAKNVAQQTLGPYLQAPSYLDMFAKAGYEIENGVIPEQMFDEMFVYGTTAQIAERIQQAAEIDIDELMLRVEPVENPFTDTLAVAAIIAQLNE
ncbi:MAG: LLM class flavin-dependent oxidoreductase [Chloroflexi bacterium]|nr:LLM class flavin-dependent oxidoreductase [Chloroflexota bacterium]